MEEEQEEQYEVGLYINLSHRTPVCFAVLVEVVASSNSSNGTFDIVQQTSKSKTCMVI